MTPTMTYISGPISGIPEGNQKAFYHAQFQALCRGEVPVNPHELGQEVPLQDGWNRLTKRQQWRVYMNLCIKVIPDCHKMVMLRGWIWSSGARVEHRLARGLGIEVIYEGGVLGALIRTGVA